MGPKREMLALYLGAADGATIGGGGRFSMPQSGQISVGLSADAPISLKQARQTVGFVSGCEGFM
jgi:hypothetical protein